MREMCYFRRLNIFSQLQPANPKRVEPRAPLPPLAALLSKPWLNVRFGMQLDELLIGTERTLPFSSAFENR